MNEIIKIPAPDDMSYEAAEWHLLRRGLSTSFAEKLEWLEGAHELAEAIRRSRESAQRENHAVDNSSPER
jgi:hypothetical protein